MYKLGSEERRPLDTPGAMHVQEKLPEPQADEPGEPRPDQPPEPLPTEPPKPRPTEPPEPRPEEPHVPVEKPPEPWSCEEL